MLDVRREGGTSFTPSAFPKTLTISPFLLLSSCFPFSAMSLSTVLSDHPSELVPDLISPFKLSKRAHRVFVLPFVQLRARPSLLSALFSSSRML